MAGSMREAREGMEKEPSGIHWRSFCQNDGERATLASDIQGEKGYKRTNFSLYTRYERIFAEKRFVQSSVKRANCGL
jgi:hypothetical protein